MVTARSDRERIRHRAAAWALASLAIAGSSGALPAFPGAEGFGSHTPGGRGGRLIFVTHTGDSGPGSLREALAAPGPRIVVFRTGGTITLRTSLEIRHPHVTLAGQTAPGGGIEIRNDPNGSSLSDSFPSLSIDSEHVVIRYLRIRPGTLNPDPACAGAAPSGGRCQAPNDIDAIHLAGAREVVLDHVSASWATDEIIGAGYARDLTLQWSILSEGIRDLPYATQATHEGSKGMLLGNQGSVEQGRRSGRISIHHNLWAHNRIRSPQLGLACPAPGRPLDCVADVVNNVVYNWGHTGTLITTVLGHSYANVVGNYYRAGPDTHPQQPGIGLRVYVPGAADALVQNAELGVYAAGNVDHGGGATAIECAALGGPRDAKGNAVRLCDWRSYARAQPFESARITAVSAQQAWQDVIRDAGASRRLVETGGWQAARDGTDQRIAYEVWNGLGRIPAGAHYRPPYYPIAAGSPPADTDSDGMPDAWETRYGLPPFAPAPTTADTDADGYPDLEEWLNGTDPRNPGFGL